MAGRGAALILVVSLLGLVVLVVYSSGVFGVALTTQVSVSLVVPALVMVIFWRAIRARLRQHDAGLDRALGLERVTNRATNRFLADMAHLVEPHLERCNVKAEALVVAFEYLEVGADLKVAVPDIVIETDSNILRQILHVLVGNAIRHGGQRVAIWGVPEGDSVRITVSDDGPGLSDGSGARMFDRYVDLAEQVGAAGSAGSGLGVVRGLGEHIGAELGYKKDPSWTHFSVSLPSGSTTAGSTADRVPLEAGVS